MSHNRKPMLALSLVALLAVAACNGDSGDDTTPADNGGATTTAGGSTPAGGDPASISIADFSYSGPDTVAVGTTVTVSNNDGVNHSWTSEDDVFDSESLAPGETFEFTFDEAGEYPFFCTIHPGQMTGTITVEG